MNSLLFFITTCCFALFHPLYAQINVDSIALQYSSIQGQSSYQALVNKLNHSDSTLQKQDFIDLYYGIVSQPQYNIAYIDSLESKIKEYNLLQEFIEAYELCDSLQQKHPVSITAHFEKSFACYGLKRIDEEALAKQKYYIFIKCVLRSGNGLSDAPFQIVSYNDAIELVKYLQVKYKTIQEEDHGLLVVALSKKYNGIDKLYFKLVTF